MTSALYVQTRKEVRALLPWAIGVALTTVALSLLANRNSGFPNFRYEQQVWFVLVHAGGVLAIAAMSLGQELTYGTFSALLVQPIDRRRVLWIKLAVLSGVVIALGLVADLAFADWYFARAGRTARKFLIWGPPIVGIGLVPLLTLLSRKPLGGAVFAVTIPGLILVVAQRVFHNDAQAVLIAWDVTVVACACGLAGLLYTFPRAEVAGDGQASSRAAAARVETPAAPVAISGASRIRAKQSWIWLSIVKELRLQQLTLAVSGLFGLLGAVVLIAQRMDPPYAGPGIAAGAILHGVFVAMIAGSRASAEERHLGVLTAQTLHPRAVWQQWVIKVSVTLSFVLVLTVALPWLFTLVDADKLTSPGGGSILRASVWSGLESEYFVGVVLGAAAALYVSSLSSNSLWALLACLPTGGAILAVMVSVDPIVRSLRQGLWVKFNSEITPAMQGNFRDAGWRVLTDHISLVKNVEDYLSIVLTVGFSLFVLYLAHRNHRSVERGARRIALQAGMIAASLVVATATYFGVSHLTWSIIH